MLVSDGIYIESIDFKNKSIAVIGTDPRTTFINAENAQIGTPAVIITSTGLTKPVIRSFTILNGYGGIKADGAIIRSCIITDSQSHEDLPRSANLMLGANNIVENCLIVASVSNGDLSSIGVHYGSNNHIINCTIINQSGKETFVVGGTNAELNVKNSIIDDQNKFCIRQIFQEGDKPLLRLSYCLLNYDVSSKLIFTESVWQGKSREVINSGQIEIGNGVIYGNPLFIAPKNNDYRLSDTSPCIGSGNRDTNTNQVDLEGNLRPNPIGSEPDIGAYESALSSPMVNIPNPNFRVKLEELLNKKRGEIITKKALAKIEKIDSPFYDLKVEQQITDITGIQHCVNLKFLNLENHRITQITPILNLIHLTHLNFGKNSIKNIAPISNLVNLTFLGLADNKTSDILALANLISLETLIINNNRITDISALENLTNLRKLEIQFNSLDDISVMANLRKLKHLQIRSNGLGLIQISDLEGLEDIEELDISGNRIQDIGPLRKLLKLKKLHISSNNISDIYPLTQLIELKSLQASNNRIVDVKALDKLENLETLSLQNNQIIDISPLVNLINLKELLLRNNQILDISTITHKREDSFNLTKIDLKGNPLNNNSLTVQIPILLERRMHVEYDPPPADTLTFNDYNLEKTVRLNLGIPTKLLKTDDLAQLRELDVKDSIISDITVIQYCPNLIKLSLTRTEQINDIAAISSATKLTELRLDWNRISDLGPISNLINLEYLSISGNQIKNINAISNLTNLKELELGHNQISDIIALSNLTQLRKLNLDNNKVGNIAVLSEMDFLAELTLSSNQIADVSVLLENKGIPGEITLNDNPLSNTSVFTHLPILRSQGKKVKFDELPDDVIKMNDFAFEASLRKVLPLPVGLITKENTSGIKELILVSSGLINIDVEAVKAFPELELINLADNPLSQEAILAQIPALEISGLTVDLGADETNLVELSLDQSELLATQAETAILTITAKDTNDKLVKREVISLATDKGSIETIAKNQGDGSYYAVYTGTGLVGEVEITAVATNGVVSTII